MLSDISRAVRAAVTVAFLAVPPGATASAQEVLQAGGLGAQTLIHLRNLVRIDTTNPPGNEWEAVQYFDSVLAGVGVQTLKLETAPGRGILLARLKGEGGEKPIIVLGHMDVVGVQREKWSVDPFEAVVREGYLYGRGAIDDKAMLAAELVAMLELERAREAGRRLSRDVVFLALPDEESGGTFGMKWLLENRPELVECAAFALNEGGRVREVGGKVLYAAVQNTEKVAYDIKLSARGSGGHGSVPVPDNAIAALARTLARVSEFSAPMELDPTTRRFFDGLSRVWPDGEMGRAMADLASPDPTARARAEAKVSTNLPFNSMLRNSVSLTMVDGGIRTNVIPTEATANLNVRMLPGADVAAFVSRLETLAAEPAVSFAYEENDRAAAPPSPVEGPLFHAVEEVLGELAPGAAVVPYMSTGATDSARLRLAGIPAYGLLPFPLTEEDELRMHGDDERIPLASLEFGAKLIYGVLARLALEAGPPAASTNR